MWSIYFEGHTLASKPPATVLLSACYKSMVMKCGGGARSCVCALTQRSLLKSMESSPCWAASYKNRNPKKIKHGTMTGFWCLVGSLRQVWEFPVSLGVGITITWTHLNRKLSSYSAVTTVTNTSEIFGLKTFNTLVSVFVFYPCSRKLEPWSCKDLLVCPYSYYQQCVSLQPLQIW